MTAARSLTKRNDPRVEAARASADPALRAEIVDGSVLMSPAPLNRHQVAQGSLFAALRRMLSTRRGDDGGSRGRWVFVQCPELHLGEGPDKFNPDVCGWRIERAPSLDEYPIVTVPDWVCEVLSPNTESFDRGTKLPAFARHGVAHAWLVDPDAQTLEAYRLDKGVLRASASFAKEDIVRAEPFSDVTIELSELWGW